MSNPVLGGPTHFFDPAPWIKDAACVGSSVDLFFPGLGETVREAKAICARCPVREECLQYALDNNIRFGVFGGTSERERRRVRSRRSAERRGSAA